MGSDVSSGANNLIYLDRVYVFNIGRACRLSYATELLQPNTQSNLQSPSICYSAYSAAYILNFVVAGGRSCFQLAMW